MKINLKEVLSGFFSTGALNNNFQAIKDAFDKCLFRDGTGPNSMQADLDMDSNRIINLPAPVSPTEPLRKDDQFTTEEAQGFAQAASDSADAAADSAEAAADSADAAADYETKAGQWAENPEDVEVETGKYSAFHHAAKAAASAASVNLPAIGAGDADKFLRVNSAETGYDLEEFYQEEIITLGGDFSGTDNVRVTRVGRQVTISPTGPTSTTAHTTSSNPFSALGVIPTWARPPQTVSQVLIFNASRVCLLDVSADGRLSMTYRDWSGALTTTNNPLTGLNISYNV